MRAKAGLLLSTLFTHGCQCQPSGADARDSAPAAASSAPSTAAPRPLPLASTIPAPRPAMIKHSSTNYASTARASRVHVSPRRLSELTLIAPLSESPRFVLVSERGDHVGIDKGLSYEIRTAEGAITSHGEKSPYGALTLLSSSYLVHAGERRWDGQEGSFGFSNMLSDANIQWAVEMSDPLHSYATLVHARRERAQGTWRDVPPQVWIESASFFLPDRIQSSLIFSEILDGPGSAAIAEDRRIVVAMQAGRFIVFDGNHSSVDPETGNSKGHRLVDVPIPFAAYELSILDTGYALLSVGAPIAEPRPSTDLERALALAARRVEFPREAPPRWTTVLHLLDESGKQIAEALIPFEVYEPPVDAGNGRVYLLGNGVAAFENGKLLFAHPSPVPYFATAFQDGSLALAAGQELRILDRAGNILQKFTTREHEAITTPPAIAADASIWVGTAKGLYLAQ